jgi:hypothetical protein
LYRIGHRSTSPSLSLLPKNKARSHLLVLYFLLFQDHSDQFSDHHLFNRGVEVRQAFPGFNQRENRGKSVRLSRIMGSASGDRHKILYPLATIVPDAVYWQVPEQRCNPCEQKPFFFLASF